MPPKTKSLSVPEAAQPRYNEITALTDALCREKLNEEYAQLCHEMTTTLGAQAATAFDRRACQKLGRRDCLYGRLG